MKHILTRDDSGHWYVIPADKSSEFNKWVESEGEEDQPEWAVRVGGSPSLVKFTTYEIS